MEMERGEGEYAGSDSLLGISFSDRVLSLACPRVLISEEDKNKKIKNLESTGYITLRRRSYSLTNKFFQKKFIRPIMVNKKIHFYYTFIIKKFIIDLLLRT